MNDCFWFSKGICKSRDYKCNSYININSDKGIEYEKILDIELENAKEAVINYWKRYFELYRVFYNAINYNKENI